MLLIVRVCCNNNDIDFVLLPNKHLPSQNHYLNCTPLRRLQ
ncbi:hypothetical protein PSPO_b0798 [Pseudoalteromonas spongiae UST010723-006]|nr:hypothetical protein PSPO_b0798 [Pseudoalteromonas spongiae UST010723-006]